MNVRVKARRRMGLVVFAAATAFLFATASPASAQDSIANNEHPEREYHAGVDGSCENGYALYLTNYTHHDAYVLIRLNGVDTIVKVEAGYGHTEPLTLNEDTPNTLLVKVGHKILLQKSFSVDCLPDPTANLSASITVDCEGSSVTVVNEGDADGTATLTVNGSSVTIDVAAGETVTTAVVLNEDADNTIAVTAGDTTLASKTAHVDCEEEEEEEETPPTTTTPPTITVPEPEPTVEVLGETVEQPQTLAFTGRNTLFEAMIGVFMLGLGLQLMRSSRRLEQNG
jgi:hypothetical protein